MTFTRRPITRRTALGGLAALPFATAYGKVRTGWDTVVVGAGVFGAWTAEHLRRAGQRVLLVDAWGPANSRASSGGESRMTRGSYGASKLYSAMALESLADWRALNETATVPLFHETGVLILFDREHPFASASRATLEALGMPVERLTPASLQQRWPQIDFSGIAFGQYEPGFGALMARRAVATLVASFIDAGGSYRQTAIEPPAASAQLRSIRTSDGDDIEADNFVFACGPWLGKLFPELIGVRQSVTRQDVLYFRPQAGDTRYAAASMPGWAEFIGDRMFYGFPDLESRGFKIADDTQGAVIDVDTIERAVRPADTRMLRAHMARRFPGLAQAPLSESRVCQYTNSASGDFLIDRHPGWSNTVLAGMGCGHGFKHGPSVGKRAAALLLTSAAPEPAFALASKAPVG